MRVMNIISMVGDSISLINILMTEYHNIVNSLGLLPKNVAKCVILQKIIAEGSNKFAGTKFPENGKVILSEMIKAVTTHQTEYVFKFVLHVALCQKTIIIFFNCCSSCNGRK